MCILGYNHHPIAEYGEIHYHISNGGNYYIYTDVTQFGLDIRSSPGSDLITTAGKLKAAVTDSITLTHPENDSPAKLTGVFFYSNPLNDLSDTVSELCIYEKMVSRCTVNNGVIFVVGVCFIRVLYTVLVLIIRRKY